MQDGEGDAAGDGVEEIEGVGDGRHGQTPLHETLAPAHRAKHLLS